MAEEPTKCEYARERHHSMLRWRNLWTILLFVVGSAIVLFLVVAIVFLLREGWLPAAVAALAALVDGAALKWVVDQRRDAVAEEEAAYKDVLANCRTTSSADALRESYRLKLF